MLLLDEPMAGINPTLGARLLDHMQTLRAERGITFLFIEHDMEVVMGHSDRVIVMAEGRVIASGPPEEVRRDQRVIDAYLGGGPRPWEAERVTAEQAHERRAARDRGRRRRLRARGRHPERGLDDRAGAARS